MAQLSPLFTPTVMEQVKALVSDANSTGARVSAWESIQKLLIDANLAWSTQVQPEFVGVHPMNRSRLGIGGMEAHHHGAQILRSGFSWKKAADACAIELPPPPHDATAVAFNEQNIALSDGLLPPLPQIKLLSLGGGHTNAFLRAVKANCRSAVASLGTTLCKDAICSGPDRVAFKEAVEKGLHWLVLHWQVEQAWPELVHFVQAALNTHAKGEQSEVEVMLDMSRMREHAVAAGLDPDWKAIQAAASHTLPACSSYVSSLAAFVKKQAPELIAEISLFQKSFSCASSSTGTGIRVLGGDFFEKVSNLKFGKIVNCPYVLNAVVKANFISPPTRIVDGICRLIQPGSVGQLVSKTNIAASQQAEQIMTDARSLCSTLPDNTQVKLLGQLDVRLILHILKKSKEVEGKAYANIASIAKVSSL